MVGERDHREQQQDAVRWEQIDDAAISIPPPFNSSYNGTIPHNHRHQQQQQYSAMLAEGADGGMSEEIAGHWDDNEQMGFMGDSMGMSSAGMEKGVRFPTSPTHEAGFFNSQLSQAPLHSVHSRYF